MQGLSGVWWMLLVAVGVQACGAPQSPPANPCPSSRVRCACAAVERQAPPAEVEEQIRVLRSWTPATARTAVRAALALETRCRAADGWLPPPTAAQDDAWRQRCGEAEAALPALLRAVERLEETGGAGYQNSDAENSLTLAVVSALSNIVLGNPQSPCREDASQVLRAALEKPEATQNFRINYQSARYLGALGDADAAPALVRALFVRSHKQRVSLREVAWIALQQLRPPLAAASALVEAGRLEDPVLEDWRRSDSAVDLRAVKEEVALTLGHLGVTDEPVVEYLMAELEAPGAEAPVPPGEGAGSTADETRALRRRWAAEALGRLRVARALPVIVERLRVHPDGRMVDPSVRIDEVPGYIEAAGDFLLPDQTNEVLLLWARRGDEPLQRRALRRLALQADSRLAQQQLAPLAASWPSCQRSASPCVRRVVEDDYLPALSGAEACADVDCWARRLAERPRSLVEVELAASHVVLLAGDDPALVVTARAALLAALEETTREAADALVLALDRLAARGCSADCLQALEAYLERRQQGATVTADVRAVSALLGRLRAR